MGRAGAVAALLAETLPLRGLYRSSPFVTISHAGRRDLVELGIPDERIHVGYLGVEQGPFAPGERAAEPRLLYLGRLKQYKRIELLLDVLEGVPAAHLDIAGEGDHRQALEARDRAPRPGASASCCTATSPSSEKGELLARSWVNLTASSAEGWCLTVMEAALCETPSVALRVGGLPESIVDGETGLLADDGPELTAQRPPRWSRTASCASGSGRRRARAPRPSRGTGRRARRCRCWRRRPRREPERLRQTLAASETLKAVGLAAATLASNAVALLFTVLFARILGADGYGSLAALLSTFLILAVPGSAVQVAVARETALGRLGSGGELAATLARWRRTLLVACAVVAVVAALLREQIASVLSVEEAWAAAMTLPTGCLWLLLSVERGALQGQHAYRPIAWSLLLEAFGRLAFGLVLVAAGLGSQRRLSRHAAVAAGRGRRARLGLAAAAGRAGARSRHRAAARADAGRVAGRARPLPRGGPAERRRDPRQAPDRRRRGRRLRRRRRGRQGRHVGGDRGRALPAAGGRAPRTRGRRSAAGAAARAGGRLARGAADAARLRGRARAGAAAGLRRGDRRRRGGAVHARAGDDAAGGRVPVRAVHARPQPRHVPLRAGSGGGSRDRAAVRRRPQHASRASPSSSSACRRRPRCRVLALGLARRPLGYGSGA